MNNPDDFEIKPEDNEVVRIFKAKKLHMWFREPIDNPKAMFNNLK